MSVIKPEDQLSAFPWVCDDLRVVAKGMTMRDYFAAKAMQTLIEIYLSDSTIETPDDRRKEVSIAAYKQADAMMKARNQ